MTARRSTLGALADTEVRYRQRYADLAVHPEVRQVFRTPGRGHRLSCGDFSTSAGFSRSRPPSSSRSMAAPRRGRSSPTTTRSTCRCTYGSRTSCTSSGCWWADSSGCTRSGTTSATRAWTGPTIPSSPCSSSTRPMPTTSDMMNLTEAMIAGVVRALLGTTGDRAGWHDPGFHATVSAGAHSSRRFASRTGLDLRTRLRAGDARGAAAQPACRRRSSRSSPGAGCWMRSSRSLSSLIWCSPPSWWTTPRRCRPWPRSTATTPR